MEDDWELLHNSDDSNIKAFEGIEGDFSNGIIRSDYFSLDAQTNNKYHQGGYVTEEGSVESDNPSWIDPESVIRYPMKESAEFWSDSSTDRSDYRNFEEFDARSQLGSVENDEIIQASFDGIGEIGRAETENLGTLSSDNQSSRGESELSIEEKESSREVENVAIEAKSAGLEEEKKSAVWWWKLPLELLKYCVFRASPIWSISVAAAVMGFVILGRRLYKMKKKKSRSLPLKVTLDDKKVSQFMSRAARLNEAFSVVKRVPVIRPSLPAAGVTPWPMMSLR